MLTHNAPSVQEHLKGADAHTAFASRLRVQSDQSAVVIGWAVTALFYAALHELRAYVLANHGIHVSAHHQFRLCYTHYPELRRTQRAYAVLKAYSESARYYLNPHLSWLDFETLHHEHQQIRATWRVKTVGALATISPS